MEIKVIRSSRRTLCIEIKTGCEVILRAPYSASDKAIAEFYSSKKGWVEKHLSELPPVSEPDEERKKELRALAKAYIPKRVENFSKIMNLTPSSVKITSAKRSFGSCSGKNALCFSLYLMQYPRDAVDYVIIHELAHIKHKNHGKDFYSLIEKYMPDYKEIKKKLKNPDP